MPGLLDSSGTQRLPIISTPPSKAHASNTRKSYAVFLLVLKYIQERLRESGVLFGLQTTYQHLIEDQGCSRAYISQIKLSLTSHVGVRVECRLNSISEDLNIHREGCLAQCAHFHRGYTVWTAREL